MSELVPPNPKHKGLDFVDWSAEFRDGQDAEDIVRELRELAAAAEPWKGNGQAAGEADDDDGDPLEAVIIYADQVEPEEVNWLWQHRIAIGNITLFAGLPEAGKGFATRDLNHDSRSCDSFVDLG